MGFGASSLLLGSLASIFFALETVGWRMTYALTGALLLVIPLIGAVFISLPKEDQNGSAGTVADGLSAKEMLKTQRFWLLFIINIGLGFFGMGIIGHARYIALEAGIASSLAAFSVGLLAVCNGLGRLLFGFLNDRLGYKPSLLLSIGIMIAGGSAALISLKAGVPGVILVALSFCGVAYGALPTNASACTGEFFGMKNFGLNLSLVNMCVIVSSWGSTISGAVETATGSYTGAILLFLGIELCTFIAALFINGNR